MYILSEMSGEVDQVSLESQTAVKTVFAFMHLHSKASEIENLALNVPRQGDDAAPSNQLSRTNSLATLVDQAQDLKRSIDNRSSKDRNPSSWLRLASKLLLEEFKDQKEEKSAAKAFFERRPRVKGVATNVEHFLPQQFAVGSSRLLQSKIIRYFSNTSFILIGNNCVHLKT